MLYFEPFWPRLVSKFQTSANISQTKYLYKTLDRILRWFKKDIKKSFPKDVIHKKVKEICSYSIFTCDHSILRFFEFDIFKKSYWHFLQTLKLNAAWIIKVPIYKCVLDLKLADITRPAFSIFSKKSKSMHSNGLWQQSVHGFG